MTEVQHALGALGGRARSRPEVTLPRAKNSESPPGTRPSVVIGFVHPQQHSTPLTSVGDIAEPDRHELVLPALPLPHFSK